MKNSALNTLKESKEKVDLQSGKHILMIILWTTIYFIVLFQPESTLRTGVLFVSVMGIARRIWLHGYCCGTSALVNNIIENCTSTARVKPDFENTKDKEKQG